MDDVRLGQTLRVLRVRKGLRQTDVARRAGVARQSVGRIEAGEAGRYGLDMTRAVAAALGARIDVQLRWQGADLDRVVNAAHASLHESVAVALDELPGWTWRPEISFSIWGERGVVDILAWHAETRSLLIIELKTELVDPEALVAVMHRRVRLGGTIARDLGWDAATVSAWVIVRDTRTERRRLGRHQQLLRSAFPTEGRSMRGWLNHPSGSVSALSFWTHVAPGSRRQVVGSVKRVRLPSAPTPGARPAAR